MRWYPGGWPEPGSRTLAPARPSGSTPGAGSPARSRACTATRERKPRTARDPGGCGHERQGASCDDPAPSKDPTQGAGEQPSPADTCHKDAGHELSNDQRRAVHVDQNPRGLRAEVIAQPVGSDPRPPDCTPRELAAATPPTEPRCSPTCSGVRRPVFRTCPGQPGHRRTGVRRGRERQPHRSSPSASAEAGAAVEDAARLPVQNQRSLLRLGCVELS